MNDAIMRFSLDVQKQTDTGRYVVKRIDTGRQLHISFTDGGRPYRITDDCRAVFTGKRADGGVIFDNCTIENNVVIYKLSKNVTAEAGIVNCEIELYGADDTMLTSASFKILVNKKVYNEDDVVLDEEEVSVLYSLIGDATSAIAGANAAADNANAAADNANAEADEIRTARENGEFVGPQGPAGPQGGPGPQGETGPAGADGNNTIYYNVETSVREGSSKRISYTTAHDWTQEFSAVPQKGDMVISASSQLFRVSSASTTAVTLIHLADLGGGVKSWNDLEGRPFEAPDVLYAWNIDNEYEEVVSGAYSGPVGSGMSVDDVFFCKVSEDTPAMDVFADTTLYTVTYTDNEGSYRTSSHVPYAVSYSEQVYVAGLFVVVMADSAEYCGLTLTKGVWCSNITFDDKDPLDDSVPAPVCTLIAEILRSEGKPLHDLSIPENIARWGEVLNLIDEKLGVIENGTY